MGICYIFGAGEGKPESFSPQKDDLVIAADAGIKSLEKLSVKPDIAVGDFDSLGCIPVCGEIIKHPVMKNDTDMMLAVKTGFERGYTSFVLYGGAGGRPDHTFANVQTLTYIAKQGGIGFLDLCGFTATVIINGSLEFSNRATGTVSVFALSETAEDVSIKGLQYLLNNAEIESGFPLGVSNEFIGEPASIKIGKGTVLVIWQGSSDFIVSPKYVS